MGLWFSGVLSFRIFRVTTFSFSASVKLPVILFGPDVVVEATMNLIDKNLGQQFTVKRPGETSDPENFELYRQVRKFVVIQ